MLVRIEKRLQDPPRILMVPLDEAIIGGLPIMMGLIGRKLVIGVVVGVVLWSIWRRLKGEGGLVALVGALYWYLPPQLKLFAGLPPSDVSHWEG